MASDQKKVYIAIDLKSFYASVECRERNLDPLTTNLVVADPSRTEKTICLAVSPSLKAFGIPGRARLFEVVQRVKEVNGERLRKAPGHTFKGSSCFSGELEDPSLKLDYLIAQPRMALYMEFSTRIYKVYMRYVAPEDVHVYSIDEVFIDASKYLNTYKTTAHDLARRMIRDVLKETGITATAGIGPNLYLAKIAMDIGAKHEEEDQDGVRIAELDEMSYRRKLWDHRPLTDFWRVGQGYASRLEKYGIFTMGDVARCSLDNEDLLYELFGVNAELLIDHAWGWEPCTIEQVKAYKPENNSFSFGQVLQYPYPWDKGRLVVFEMAEEAALDLVGKRMVTDQLVLTVGYDIENLSRSYTGEVTVDRYGRKIPKHAHGTINLDSRTNSGRKIRDSALTLYDRITKPDLLIRRMTLSVNHVIPEEEIPEETTRYEQLDLFTDYEQRDRDRKKEKETLEKERQLQEAMISIKKRYGKNAILKGASLREGATAKDRNSRIGGHKA